MNHSSNQVSVLMSVYNGSQYLREAVESVLHQTFSDFEFIIINDCSTDNSREVIQEYAAEDQRIKLVENRKNIGLTKSLNKGLSLAKGNYIARQDADDISLPTRFERQVAVLNAKPEVVLVSSDIEVINAEGQFVRVEKRSCNAEFISWYLTFYNHIGGHSQVAFRRDTVMELGGYSESCRYSQDYELWCRLNKVGKIIILPEILHKLRRHDAGITTEKRSEQLAYTFQQSRLNVKHLINRELSLEELSDLRRFWAGHLWGDFPSSDHAVHVHKLLEELYQAFVEKELCTSVDARMAKRLRILIGQQFIEWVWSLSIVRKLPERLEVSQCALHWYPMGLVLFWLKETYSRPLLIARLKLFKRIGFSS